MKLIVDIPEDVYTRLFDNGIQDNEIAIDDICEMARSLRRGTPLSKGHGDLVDISPLMRGLYEEMQVGELTYTTSEVYKMLENDAPTIIEADKESEEV